MEPESEEEVVQILHRAVAEGLTIRVVGSGISPNGLGFTTRAMISMAQMDKVLRVDEAKKQVSL
jgi:L-galactono-1,4-lactone dehydrogenase